MDILAISDSAENDGSHAAVLSTVGLSSSLDPTSSGCSSITSDSSRRIAQSPASAPHTYVCSLTESLLQQAFKDAHGRRINTLSDVYRLPADEEEFDRLRTQHLILIDIMGKYCPPLEYVIGIPGDYETKACLDLGCGSGAWIIDVALDFPHTDCVAVDLIPLELLEVPPNCRFEVDDINLGLEHFYGEFDVVHARLISLGIKHYPTLIDQISHILKPGGLVELTEFDLCAYDENKCRIDLSLQTQHGQAWPRWLCFVEDIARRAGASTDAATHIHAWVKDHPMLEDVVYQEFYLPVCAWRGDGGFWDHIGHNMEANIRSFIASSRPMLLDSGISEELVAQLARNVDFELENKLGRQYTRCRWVCARKRRQQVQPP